LAPKLHSLIPRTSFDGAEVAEEFMKRRNWVLIAFCTIGLTAFVLSRTIWGPPSRALAADTHLAGTKSQGMSDAERRYLNNQPRHWRYVVLKQK
jgi:hypothetical protein